ncbi:MAG TPA: FAD-linked oxidase C-terminal domain-containing protein, partial [Candidatus Limnocylindrales bacterium]|nr:FAD-linked oxidase C-terminal domain-containing protein [Candidatus Limnocylindrales bacterium]
TRAVFRLHPLPGAARTFSFTAENIRTMQDYILAIQDSQLSHTSLQIRSAAGEPTAADILFEATDAGLAAQESQLRNILGHAGIEQSPVRVWDMRQELWNSPTNSTLLAKISMLPADMAKTLASLKTLGDSRGLNWKVVVQATGLGMLRLESEATQLSLAVDQFRTELESRGGSLFVLHCSQQLHSIDAWGNSGDGVALMRAVKHQLDPKNTLNPGRFAGGI